MKPRLKFLYPNEPIGQFDILLATKAYEAIWQEDSDRIIERFKHYTGLDFAQDEIEVMIHDDMSMSGMRGRPMRLSTWNNTLQKRRSALVHELAHRLLFGYGLYAEPETDSDNDEIRAYLVQGNILEDLYGQEAYDEWASSTDKDFEEAHIQAIHYVTAMTKGDRMKMIKKIIAEHEKTGD